MPPSEAGALEALHASNRRDPIPGRRARRGWGWTKWTTRPAPAHAPHELVREGHATHAGHPTTESIIYVYNIPNNRSNT
jgi:hypothetical protein